MSDTIRNFQISEDRLAGMEAAFTLILEDAVDSLRINERPGLRDALQMMKEGFSEVRFPIPSTVQIIPATDEP